MFLYTGKCPQKYRGKMEGRRKKLAQPEDQEVSRPGLVGDLDNLI